MTVRSPQPRLAVLIDGDSPSPGIADELFAQVARLGQASIRRIYGDFSRPQIKAWADAMTRHAIVPHQQSQNTPGKNATDIALVIDAMDVLHAGLIDGFCIVSSDGDFTRLAARIREHGLMVYGFGAKQAPESFRKACGAFFELELPPPEPQLERLQPKPAPVPKAGLSAPHKLLHMIHAAISEIDGEDGWIALSVLGLKLNQRHPGYKNEIQGAKKLATLVRNTQAFDLEERTEKGWWIRPIRAIAATNGNAQSAHGPR
ncbi:hypothetical protein sos41_00500 [Alphaproteobacteria bacterium SO-S41]|nr:hypothetical protein sos41_00500 [Alphaproteobacteria bacterium SO-S41]